MASLLALLGCIAVAFGLAGTWIGAAQGASDSFASAANLALGALLLLAAAGLTLLAARRRHAGAARRAWLRALVLAALVLGAAGGAQFGAARLQARVDLSGEALYTLSDYTLGILAALDSDVELELVGARGRASEPELLLRRYAEASPRITVTVDPRPAMPLPGAGAAPAGIVVHAGGRRARAVTMDEHNVTKAIVALTVRDQRRICLTTGHGEAALEERGPAGLRALGQALLLEGYRVEVIELATLADVPADCAVVAIVAPERGFLPGESAALVRHAQGGGRALVMLEPAAEAEPRALLDAWQVRTPPGEVLDARGRIGSAQGPSGAAIVNRYTQHPLTASLDGTRMTLFSGARTLATGSADVRGIVWAGKGAIVLPSAPEPGAGTAPLPPDGQLPLVLAGRRETPGGEARIVVFGDSDPARNAGLGMVYNEDLVLNAIRWLADGEAPAAIRPKQRRLYQYPLQPEAVLTRSQSLALLVPQALLMIGVWTWWRRRRL